MEKPVITPPDKDYIKTINQKVFKGFSYTSAMADAWLYNETTSYKCSLTFNQSNAICDKIIVILNICRSIALLSTHKHMLIIILMHLMLSVNWRAIFDKQFLMWFSPHFTDMSLFPVLRASKKFSIRSSLF